jgi:hypothetical protein
MLNRVFTTHDGKRDLAAAFGYPEVLDASLYYEMYARGGIAARIIKAYPAATWSECPTVTDENEDPEAPFSVEFEEVAERIKLLHYLERVDRLAGIGRYAVLLLGFDDVKDVTQFSTPLTKGKQTELRYLVPYIETGTTIAEWETDPTSERFGQPRIYNLQVMSLPTDGVAASPIGKALRVHWTRTLHIAEELEQDEVYGVPRLRPVFNYLMDLVKVVGGSAETFWMAANRGMFFGTDADTMIDEGVIEDMKNQIDEYQHGQRRAIVGQGFTPTNMGSDVPDGSKNADTLLKLVAGTVGIPQRILVGNEAGEIASTQDENNWNTKVHERRTMYAGPKIIKPLIQILIDTGNISAPIGDWDVKWEEADKLGEVEQANVGKARIEGLKAYVSAPGIEVVMAPEEARIAMGMEPDSDYELLDPEDMGDGETEIDPLTGQPKVDPTTGQPLPPTPPTPGAPKGKTPPAPKAPAVPIKEVK